jgi:hypothetical protein
MSCIDIRGNRAARLCIDGVSVLVKQATAYPLNRSDVPHYSGGITACDRGRCPCPIGCTVRASTCWRADTKRQIALDPRTFGFKRRNGFMNEVIHVR